MHIDLLVSSKGEIGILSDTEFETPPSGAIFDGLEQSLTLEFSQTYDSMVMNVPLSEELAEILPHLRFLHLGVMVKGRIASAVNVKEEEYY